MGWISRNGYLSSSESEQNALIIYNYLITKGYTINSISAICGNSQIESTINPGIWESLEVDTNRGFGLFQYTPATKLINWLADRGISDYENGYNQLLMLDSGDDGYGDQQWGASYDPNAPSVIPPITWEEFKSSTIDVETLASYFMYYWEKPNYDPLKNNIAQRITYAKKYYELFGGQPTPKKRRKMPLYMMIRHF